jgi:hypothetical protein
VVSVYRMLKSMAAGMCADVEESWKSVKPDLVCHEIV